MIEISHRLLYYKRPEIQNAILESCSSREVGIRYGDNGFGKRPDILDYPRDILEAAKKGATSFHISEEIWSNPMALSTELKKQDLDNLRKGWDLVLDIDCPYWIFSKITTHLLIKSLKQHGVKSISCKFSGNKGFHIGVPFEAFPNNVNGIQTSFLFPEGPRKIALYLIDYLSNNLIKVNDDGTILFDNVFKTSLEKISKITKISEKELSKTVCSDCKKELSEMSYQREFICSKCQSTIWSPPEVTINVCKKCNVIMHKVNETKSGCSCGTKKPPKRIFDPLHLVNVDTILISYRHMFRAPYSLHEKTGLVSIPLNTEQILDFKKESAAPKNISTKIKFLERTPNTEKDATHLIIQAFDYKVELQAKVTQQKNYDLPTQAIPRECFPPSILKGLEGLQDGKKRFLFILLNFLKSLGWPHQQIIQLVNEWNEKNSEPLKQNYLSSQLRYAKTSAIMPPPNYDTGIYKDLNIEDVPVTMERYRNPIVYAKALFEQQQKISKKLTLVQKEMRKKYREHQKHENQKKGN